MKRLIECRDLNKYYGRKRVLNNINFEIESGQPVALVGPNGAGKSTLFSILSGYIQPSTGDAKIFDHLAGSPQLIGCIGALPQDALLNPNLTIFQQLSFFARLQGYGVAESQKEAERVLSLMQLNDHHQQKITELSHGMKKRVSIAQALLGKPKLVLLDEPTAGLDPENARNIRQQINALSDDITFLISSHNLDELERLCERVLYLENGELKADTSVSQVGSIKDKRYLTLRLEGSHRNIEQDIAKLTSVLSVDSKLDDELLITYEYQKNNTLDQDLLKLLAEKNVMYRQLTQGQSLESQLFSN